MIEVEAVIARLTRNGVECDGVDVRLFIWVRENFLLPGNTGSGGGRRNNMCVMEGDEELGNVNCMPLCHNVASVTQ